jgi:DNA topoisomerase-1
VQTIDSADVNAYLKEIAGTAVSAKDFRTWAGTVIVARTLAERDGDIRHSHVTAAIRAAAESLGNTPAICRKSYVHPRVMDPATWSGRTGPRSRARARGGLNAEEIATLRLLAPLSRRRTAGRPRPANRRPLPHVARVAG